MASRLYAMQALLWIGGLTMIINKEVRDLNAKVNNLEKKYEELKTELSVKLDEKNV